MPISIDAIKRAGERTQAPDDHDDEHDRPDRVRERGLREQHEAADHAGEAREPAADGEHQHEYAGHVVAKRAHHARMRQRRLDDEADPRLLERDVEEDEHRDRDRHHQALVRRKRAAEDGEKREIDDGGHVVGDGVAAPDHRDDLLDDVGESEREQDLGDVAARVDAAQAVALEQLKSLYVDFFYQRQDHFWKEEAMWKLPPLKESTNMLICGEDLGMVPGCVPDVMKQLGILSLEIQRMPKDPKREFFHPADAPYLSVITPSTHDMSTIRGWWEEDREKTQRFYNRELGQWGDAPWFCEPWINKAIVIQHLYSPAMWSIFQLQDLLGMSDTIRRENPNDERINIPANPKNYWKYRMHLNLEDLIHEKEFNEEFKGYIHSSGRDNH